MNVHCPHCSAVYRVDPARVPTGGIRARCARCSAIIPVAATAMAGAGAAAGVPAPAPAPGPAPMPAAAPVPASAPRTGDAPPDQVPPAASATAAAPERPRFGAQQDPATRARRIARALVSDIVAYHPERRDRALDAGTLRMEFKDEILKSWNEYVEQVGEDLARETSHFRDALNDVLARGQKIF